MADPTGDDATRSAPIWARQQVRRSPALSREAIVEAALKIADSGGIEAVSMRRVASALGARTMSLYTYIKSKDDLFDLLADRIAGEVLIEGEPPADWREAITMIARLELEAGRRHPWTVDLIKLRSYAVLGPNVLRHAAQSAAALAGLKLDAVGTWRVIAAIDAYVLGYCAREAREREVAQRLGQAAAGQKSLMGPYVEQLLDSEEYADVTPLLREGIPLAGDTFENGLRWLLDGIEREYL